jgi:hypothetical protein
LGRPIMGGKRRRLRWARGAPSRQHGDETQETARLLGDRGVSRIADCQKFQAESRATGLRLPVGGRGELAVADKLR